MAGKKNFAGIDTRAAGSSLHNAIEQATHKKGMQTEASPTERAERLESMRTRGRKGCKAIRINMAFTPSNHEFIQVMAKATGRTMTEFCNLIIKAYRHEHPEMMEQARDFINIVNSGMFTEKYFGQIGEDEEDGGKGE